MENGGGGGGRGSCRRGGKLAANLSGGPGTTLVTTVCWAAGDNKCWTCDPAQCAQEDFTITEKAPLVESAYWCFHIFDMIKTLC